MSTAGHHDAIGTDGQNVYIEWASRNEARPLDATDAWIRRQLRAGAFPEIVANNVTLGALYHERLIGCGTFTEASARQWATEAVERCQLNGHGGLRAAHEQTRLTGEPVERFRLIDDAALENLPAILWLVRRVIGRSGFFMLFGAPGSLKTFLALLLGFSVALGRDFHGRPVERGPVIIVAAEGAAGLSIRVRALRQWFGLGKDAAGVYFITEAVNLSDPDEVEAFIAQAAPLKPAMIIFDTLSRCAAGVEENSATEMGNVVSATDYIRRRTGAAVGFIHHPTKSGLTERGSSVLRGAVDTLLQVVRDDDVVTLSAEKVKDAEAFEPMHFRIKRVELEDGESSLVLEPTEDARQVRPASGVPTGNRALALDVLRQLGDSGATYAEWRRAFPKADSTFQRCVNDLRAWGRVEQHGARYRLVGVV